MLYDTFAGLGRELTPAMTRSATGPLQAPVDVRREPDRYVVEVDLPGVDPSKVDVTYEDGWLSIKAERSSDHETKDGDWVVRERSHASVVRGFGVDRDVDADAITADYDEGVLTLTLPLAERAKPHRITLAEAGSTPSVEAGSTPSVEAGSTPSVDSGTKEAASREQSESAHAREGLRRFFRRSHRGGRHAAHRVRGFHFPTHHSKVGAAA